MSLRTLTFILVFLESLLATVGADARDRQPLSARGRSSVSRLELMSLRGCSGSVGWVEPAGQR